MDRTAVKGPIFVMGFPRSGTTGLASGLSQLEGISKFSAEGHFIYLFRSAINRIRTGDVNENCIVRDQAAQQALFASLATGIDQAYQNATGCAAMQWIDKTPDIQQIESIPTIQKLFPDAWFFFIYRDPVSSVLSNIRTWPERLADQEQQISERWSACHAAWRNYRDLIPDDKKFEVFQPQLREDPETIVREISTKMKLSGPDASRLRAFWTTNKQVNRPTAGNVAATYDSTKLDEQKTAMILETCRAEIAEWPKIQYHLDPESAPDAGLGDGAPDASENRPATVYYRRRRSWLPWKR